MSGVPSTSPSRARLIGMADAVILAIALVLLAAGLWLVASTPPRVWIDRLADDAFYYLGVARNLVEHGRSSFAAPLDTNGYQPLWQMLLALVALIAGTSPAALALVALGLSALCLIAFALVSRRLHGATAPAILAAFAAPVVTLSGMETALIAPLAIAFLAAKDWRWRGGLGALLFLSRLDALALIVAAEAMSLMRGWGKAKGIRFDWRPWAIIAPVMLAYAAINQILFGVPVPVSGLAKAVGNVPGENVIQMVHGYGELAQGSAATVALLVFVLLARGGLKSPLRHGVALLTTCLALVICVAYYGFASGWHIWGWYGWPLLLMRYYLLLELWDSLRTPVADRWRMLAASLAALAALAFAGRALAREGGDLANLYAQGDYRRDHAERTFGRQSLDTVDWVHTHLPKGSIIAIGDRAGAFGFFLGGDYGVLHTEGLVASAGYVRALREDRAADFIRGAGVDYWMADHPTLLENDALVGLIEPVQGLSVRTGPFLVCFAREGVVFDQRYRDHGSDQRQVIVDARAERPCPTAWIDQVAAARKRYGGVHQLAF